MNIGTILKVLEHGLRLWGTKEAREYLEKYIELKKSYQRELDKKSSGHRYSQYKLDIIMREIEGIADAFVKYGDGAK